MFYLNRHIQECICLMEPDCDLDLNLSTRFRFQACHPLHSGFSYQKNQLELACFYIATYKWLSAFECDGEIGAVFLTFDSICIIEGDNKMDSQLE